MRTSVIVLSLAAYFTTGNSMAQPPTGLKASDNPLTITPKKEESKKPVPGSREDLLDRALKGNPEIRRAEAKVRQADAEYLQIRRQILAEVESAHIELLAAKNAEKVLEDVLRLQMAAKDGAVGTAQAVATATTNLSKFKMEVSKIEARLHILLGGSSLSSPLSLAISPDGTLLAAQDNIDQTIRIWETKTAKLSYLSLANRVVPLQESVGERLRNMLDKPVTMTEERPAQPFKAALDHFLDKAKVNITFLVRDNNTDWGNVKLPKGEMSVGAWLQWFEDSANDVRFVVRDYGILVVAKDRIPEGGLLLNDFWKRKPTPPKEPEPMKTPAVPPAKKAVPE